MATFQEAQEMLIEAFDEELIDEEEFVLLYDANKSKNPPFPYWKYQKFDLDSLTEAECQADFRFQKHDIYVLADTLEIPEFFKCSQGTTVDGIEGLCILLRRFAYPCRYSDMIPLCGRPVPELSMITTIVLDYVFAAHGNHLSRFNQPFLYPQALQSYCNAVQEKGAALENCFGFIDGTVRPVSRPQKNQRILYNGHKRVHAIKFQSVVTPNGLIANLFGPIEGRKHDAGMLADSGLLHHLEQFAFSPNGQPLCLYGDPAYPHRVHLQAPFRNIQMTPEMQLFNKSMSAVRVSVEWLFGDIINYFKFLDFKKNLKIGLSSVGKMYVVCSLLRNAMTCLYGNETSNYFGLDPPTIYEYFNN